MRKLRDGHVTGLLAGLSLFTVGALAYDAWATGGVRLTILGPAVAAVLMLGAWPIARGWRPFAENLRSCTVCGTQWSPRSEGVGFCPACGGADA